MLNEHTVIKMYFTLKEIRILTGLSRNKIMHIIELKNIICHQAVKGSQIKVHKKELNKFTSIKL